jgi:hypothetical protein
LAADGEDEELATDEEDENWPRMRDEENQPRIKEKRISHRWTQINTDKSCNGGRLGRQPKVAR